MSHQFYNFCFELKYFDQVGSDLEVDIVNNVALSVLVGCVVVLILIQALVASVGLVGYVSELGGHVDIQNFVGGEFRLQKPHHVQILFVIGHDGASMQVSAHWMKSKHNAMDWKLGSRFVVFGQLR